MNDTAKLTSRQPKEWLFQQKKSLLHWWQNLKFSFCWLFFKNQKIKNFNHFEKKIYSQNGEDGLLQLIFYKIGPTNKYFVEFGVEDGQECNSRWLREQGWQGLWMDGGHQNKLVKKHFITAGNIEKLFTKYQVSKNFDLLVIDIDYNDYWVWQAIKKYQPRVVVIEYNASIPPTQSRVVEYKPRAVWDGSNYFGASLLALVKLGKQKGYALVGCDQTGTNAFFVQKNLVKNNFAQPSLTELYRPPRYGLKVKGKHIGHRPSKKQMKQID